MQLNWIDNSKHKPKGKGEEFLVVWNMEDGFYPTTTMMVWDSIEKVWRDPQGSNDPVKENEVLYWMPMPKPPKGISKSLWNPNNHKHLKNT